MQLLEVPKLVGLWYQPCGLFEMSPIFSNIWIIYFFAQIPPKFLFRLAYGAK
jgi:hypothetical protein